MSKKIVVFIPAFNEEESIGDVIPHIPRCVEPDYIVEVVVIDDGSSDATEEAARRAGADEVVAFVSNRGLGAAVREGLSECVRRGADIGVMIDADNEYPAIQIPDLVAPIIADSADYTMGSRFLGTITGMRLHRRLGNYMFTLLQSILLCRWIFDGQSGMRAFSREAMEHAEIIHDYNYAQVLTLNLVRKGFRMQEIPIRYQVRKKGKSFIRFGAYMRNVIPAIIKEMSQRVPRVKQ